MKQNLWVVYYNLVGLHPPLKLTYDKQGEFYADETGDVVFDGNHDLRNRDIVATFFDSKTQADYHYDILKKYRDFIKDHL